MASFGGPPPPKQMRSPPRGASRLATTSYQVSLLRLLLDVDQEANLGSRPGELYRGRLDRVVEGGAVHTGTDAMSRVARAGGYGAKRTVPPSTVAQMFSALNNPTADSAAILNDDTAQTYKKSPAPSALPRSRSPRRPPSAAIPPSCTA